MGALFERMCPINSGPLTQYIWHPFSQMKDLDEHPPIKVIGSEGIRLLGDDGNWYYDTSSSWWSNLHGHQHPYIKEAMRSQMDQIQHVMLGGLTHEPGLNLARRLIERTNHRLSRVFFSDNGSSSIEIALKMAVQYFLEQGYPQRNQFIHLENSYHGDTGLALSVGGSNIYKSKFSAIIRQTIELPFSDHGTEPRDLVESRCIAALSEVLQSRSQTVAALILEPLLMGAGGMIMSSVGFLEAVDSLCKQYGVLLILDEVAVGFGRLGSFFASDQATINPDFICLSKGLTAGLLPMGATLCHEKIYEAFYGDYLSGKTFFHGHTFTGNPMAAAVANASLDLFDTGAPLAQVAVIEAILKAAMPRISALDHVANLRVKGCVMAMEYLKSKSPYQRYPRSERRGFQLYLRGLKEGIMLRPLGDTIYLFLPLVTTQSELEDILQRMINTIQTDAV